MKESTIAGHSGAYGNIAYMGPDLALIMVSASSVWRFYHRHDIAGVAVATLNVFIFARQYETSIEQASSAVLFGTVLSVVTVTTAMWLVKTNALPIALFR